MTPGPAASVFETTQALCRKHGLTPYDAAYLQIVLRSGCTLAMADADLRGAALAESVPVLRELAIQRIVSIYCERAHFSLDFHSAPVHYMSTLTLARATQ